jgi:hypothetical protein
MLVVVETRYPLVVVVLLFISVALQDAVDTVMFHASGELGDGVSILICTVIYVINA